MGDGEQQVIGGRLAALLETTDLLWSGDLETRGPDIARAASRLLPDVEASILLVPADHPDRLRIVAASADWIDVGFEMLIAEAVAGQAVRSRRPVEVTDATRSSPAAPFLGPAGADSARCVPLTDGQAGPAFGVVSFLRRGSRPFSAEERLLIDEFGKRLSLGAERRRLLAEARAAAERFQLALDTTLHLAAALDPNEVVNRLLERAVTGLQTQRATLSRVTAEAVEIVATYDRDSQWDWGGRRYPRAMVEAQPLVKRALETGEPVVGGPLEAARAAPEFKGALAAVHHSVSLGLRYAGAVQGLLVVSRREDRPFTADEVALMRLIGSSAGVALRNADLFQEVDRTRSEAARTAARLQVGVDLALDLASRSDTGQIVPRVLRRAADAAAADRCVLAMRHGAEVLIEDTFVKQGDAPPRGARLRIDEQPLLREAFQTGRPVQSETIDRASPGVAGMTFLTGVSRFATIPLSFAGEVVGVLNLSRHAPVPFTTEELDTVGLIGQVAALALRNARLIESLAEANRAKSDFLNLAAHELRTPLGVIAGYVSMLRDGSLGPPPEEWVRVLEVLHGKSQELGALVDGLLEASRIQAGAVRPNPVLTDLAGIAGSAVTRALPRARLLNADIALESQETVAVHADAEQIGRVLDNLLNNALTYSQGRPWIRVRVMRRDRLGVIEVEDRGVGIPEADQERVFEQFARLEQPGIGFPAGTGLGLYIARQVAELHGGSLRLAHSAPGAGSRFELALPLGAD